MKHSRLHVIFQGIFSEHKPYTVLLTEHYFNSQWFFTMSSISDFFHIWFILWSTYNISLKVYAVSIIYGTFNTLSLNVNKYLSKASASQLFFNCRAPLNQRKWYSNLIILRDIHITQYCAKVLSLSCKLSCMLLKMPEIKMSLFSLLEWRSIHVHWQVNISLLLAFGKATFERIIWNFEYQNPLGKILFETLHYQVGEEL